MRAVLVIACRDEEACIAAVVSEARLHFDGSIIVVDNGSRDRTAIAAQNAGAFVVSESTAGYGRACMAGVAAASGGCDAFVFMDGDGSDCPEDIPRLLAALENSDLAIGVRRGPRVQPGAIAPAARFGNWLSGLLIGLATGQRVADLAPLKAIRAETLRTLAPREQTHGWTVELLARAAACRMSIAEVETGYRPRAGGQSKVSGSVLGSAQAGLGICSVLARLMITSVSAGTLGAIVGVVVALAALGGWTGWLISGAPSSRDVLVSTWLLAWPLLLLGGVAGALAGTAVARPRSQR